MSFACILYTPAYTNPNKSFLENGSGNSPVEGITTPFPARTTDFVWDNLLSSAVARRAPRDGVSHTVVHLKVVQMLSFTLCVC